MPLKNTADRFGSVSKAFHWLTALLILVLMPLGMVANRLPYETSEQLAQKAWLFSLHKTLGVVVFFVALARILWALRQPKPGLLHPDRKAESLAAETVHWLLYGSLIAVPLTGWVHHAATTGFAPISWPFGQNLPLVAKSEAVAAISAGAHWVLTKVLVLAVLLHIAGALKHHIIDKDATLRRMWFGNPPVPPTESPHRHATPVVIAVVLWALALSGGAVLGIYSSHGRPATAVELEQVQGGWQVQDGTLTITVNQLGADVTGAFADWTAAINFDESIPTGVAGRVEVTIAIASLTLGSVTDQAMGPDFFNTVDFPTAVFAADIIAVVDGYKAQGTLTIKDQSLPVSLPFGLSVSGDQASMIGGLTLDRRSFGIGDNLADESTLHFKVSVDVELVAMRMRQAPPAKT